MTPHTTPPPNSQRAPRHHDDEAPVLLFIKIHIQKRKPVPLSWDRFHIPEKEVAAAYWAPSSARRFWSKASSRFQMAFIWFFPKSLEMQMMFGTQPPAP